MMNTFSLLLVSLLKIYFVFGKIEGFVDKDYDATDIILPPDNATIPIINGTINETKALLRYGFHRTHDCQIFEKAFLCIRMCLDFGFHIAESNKKCRCKCFKNSMLAKHKPPNNGFTSWKLGAPTTSRPPWAHEDDKSDLENAKPLSNKEQFADIVLESESETDEEGSGEHESSGEGSGTEAPDYHDDYDEHHEEETDAEAEAESEPEEEHESEAEGESEGEPELDD